MPPGVGPLKGDLHSLPITLVNVVELVEVPKKPVLHDKSRMADLAGDVGVGDGRRLAARFSASKSLA